MAVALLWHLHQPEYRDPRTGIPFMPWTRLHALRGYRDLLIESTETGAPWTVNIVPGLWAQLMHYANGGGDRHLDLTGRPADGLSEDEVDEITASFPCGHPAMRSHPRYRELEALIGERVHLDTTALRDLQVWSTLAWFGATARRDHPELDALRVKGRGFDEDDKATLLAAQRTILTSYPRLLQAFVATEGPRLSTSPLHHPILPLLIDLQHARRSVKHGTDTEFAYPEDALAQLIQGKACMEAASGGTISGCWPSEGAVSPEVIPLLAEAGFAWVASDEQLLAKSERVGAGEGGWDLGHGVRGFFRDHDLSDRIGFVYARMVAADALRDFTVRARSTGVKLVALDGENPWEAYPDAGGRFRAGLASWLMKHGTTLDAACDLEPVGRVERLHTGSWIGASLEIWAGSDADHRGWSLLADARAVATPEAMPHLLAAEGSDWFWWFGPEFDTPFAGVFDAAFRAHLRAAWKAAGLEPPEVLNHPVEAASAGVTEPNRSIQGGETPLGWLGAGRWVLPQGSMARAVAPGVDFGWDPVGALWLRVPHGVELRMSGDVVAPGIHRIAEAPRVVLEVEGARVELLRHDWLV